MSEANKVLKSSSLLIGSQFLVRAMGLVSTLVIARLLAPEDFGILAISMLVIAFTEMLTMTGSNQYIHQKHEVSKSDVNTAWTSNILLKCVIAVLIVCIAPYAADYYNDQRLRWTITVLSSLMIMQAFSNPGVMLLEKAINYKKSITIDISKKLLSAICTILFALTLGDYRALIYGYISSSFLSLILSYILIDYRPQFSLANIKEQWGFSKYALLLGAMGFCRSHIDTLIVSKVYSTAVLGAYNTIKYVSSMPSSEVIIPALKPMIATFAKKKDNLDDLRHQFILTVLILSLLIIPIGTFLNVNSYEVVSILLGEKWLEYSFIFEYLVLITITSSFSAIAGQMLIACGYIKYSFRFNTVSFVILVVILMSVINFELRYFLMVKVAFEICVSFILFTLVMIFVLKMNPFKILFTILASFSIQYIYAIFLHDLGFSNHYVLVDTILNGILFVLGSIIINIIIFKLLWLNSPVGQHLFYIAKQVVQRHYTSLKSLSHKD